MPRYMRVTQTWDIEIPEDVDDPYDYARDATLSIRPDTEDIEEIAS
mgnify:CR=1 FL=1